MASILFTSHQGRRDRLEQRLVNQSRRKIQARSLMPRVEKIDEAHLLILKSNEVLESENPRNIERASKNKKYVKQFRGMQLPQEKITLEQFQNVKSSVNCEELKLFIFKLEAKIRHLEQNLMDEKNKREEAELQGYYFKQFQILNQQNYQRLLAKMQEKVLENERLSTRVRNLRYQLDVSTNKQLASAFAYHKLKAQKEADETVLQELITQIEKAAREFEKFVMDWASGGKKGPTSLQLESFMQNENWVKMREALAGNEKTALEENAGGVEVEEKEKVDHEVAVHNNHKSDSEAEQTDCLERMKLKAKTTQIFQRQISSNVALQDVVEVHGYGSLSKRDESNFKYYRVDTFPQANQQGVESQYEEGASEKAEEKTLHEVYRIKISQSFQEDLYIPQQAYQEAIYIESLEHFNMTEQNQESLIQKKYEEIEARRLEQTSYLRQQIDALNSRFWEVNQNLAKQRQKLMETTEKYECLRNNCQCDQKARIEAQKAELELALEVGLQHERSYVLAIERLELQISQQRKGKILQREQIEVLQKQKSILIKQLEQKVTDLEVLNMRLLERQSECSDLQNENELLQEMIVQLQFKQEKLVESLELRKEEIEVLEKQRENMEKDDENEGAEKFNSNGNSIGQRNYQEPLSPDKLLELQSIEEYKEKINYLQSEVYRLTVEQFVPNLMYISEQEQKISTLETNNQQLKNTIGNLKTQILNGQLIKNKTSENANSESRALIRSISLFAQNKTGYFKEGDHQKSEGNTQCESSIAEAANKLNELMRERNQEIEQYKQLVHVYETTMEKVLEQVSFYKNQYQRMLEFMKKVKIEEVFNLKSKLMRRISQPAAIGDSFVDRKCAADKSEKRDNEKSQQTLKSLIEKNIPNVGKYVLALKLTQFTRLKLVNRNTLGMCPQNILIKRLDMKNPSRAAIIQLDNSPRQEQKFYRPPEASGQRQDKKKSLVWTLGVIIDEIFVGSRWNENPEECSHKNAYHFRLSSGEAVGKILKMMLMDNKDLRPSLEEVEAFLMIKISELDE